jgi:hypothetical protein
MIPPLDPVLSQLNPTDILHPEEYYLLGYNAV